MNYKNLFKIAYRLISSPAKAWEEILVSNKSSSWFIYPMMLLACCAKFVGCVISEVVSGKYFTSFTWMNEALTVCFVPFVADFFGFFLAVWLLRKADRGLFGHNSNPHIISVLVGYSMVVVFTLQIIEGLVYQVFPSFSILKDIFQFYILYVVWEGVGVIHIASERRHLSYTLVTSFIILISVWLIGELYGIASVYLGTIYFK